MNSLVWKRFLAFGCLAVVLGGCGAAVEPDDTSDDQSNQSDELKKKKKKKPQACLSKGDTCGTGSTDCCAGTTCVEYTPYDRPRCMKKVPNSEVCSTDSDCESGHCIEYTVYDYPRCFE